MATEAEGKPAVEFEEIFSPRIDELVESALQDQAREQQMLLDTVHTAQREMKALRELLERRDLAVVDMIEARLAGIASENRVEHIATLVDGLSEQPKATEVVAPAIEQLAALGNGLQSVGSRLEAIEAGLEKLDPWKPALELQRALTARLGEFAGGIRDHIEEKYSSMGEKLDEVSRVELEQLHNRWDAVTGRLKEAEAGIGAKTEDQTTMLSKLVGDKSASLSRLVTTKSSQLSEQVGQISAKTDTLKEAIAQASALTEESRELIQSTGARTFDRLVKMHTEAGKLAEALSQVSMRLEERFDTEQAEARKRAAAISRQIEDTRTSLTAQGSATAQAIGAHSEKMSSDLFEHMEGFHRALVDQTERGIDAIGTSIDPFTTVLRKLAKRVQDSNRRITDSNARIESLYESLLSYLSQRDQHLEHVRDQVLIDLMEHLGDALKRRDRVRLTEAMKRAEDARKDHRDAQAYRKLMGAQRTPPEKEELDTLARQIAESRVEEEETPVVIDEAPEVELVEPLVATEAPLRTTRPKKKTVAPRPRSAAKPKPKTKAKAKPRSTTPKPRRKRT